MSRIDARLRALEADTGSQSTEAWTIIRRLIEPDHSCVAISIDAPTQRAYDQAVAEQPEDERSMCNPSQRSRHLPSRNPRKL